MKQAGTLNKKRNTEKKHSLDPIKWLFSKKRFRQSIKFEGDCDKSFRLKNEISEQQISQVSNFFLRNLWLKN